MSGFILTWKESVWPYEHLHDMINIWRRDGVVEIPWRVFAHRLAKPNDLAFLLKQGTNPRGISGVGTLLDAPSLRTDPTDPGPPRMRATVRFHRLIDSKSEPFLILLSELEGVLPTWQINAQASGQAPLIPQAEQWLIERLGTATAVRTPSPRTASEPSTLRH